jgi:hypothetical protein
MKWAVFSLYALLVVLGAIPIALRSRQSFEFTASRDLPPNHRVLISDLREPDTAWALAPSLPESSRYTGRYLDREVDTGNPVKQQYLKMRPEIKPGPNTEAFPWLLRESDRQWLEVLDVGWRVDLCAESCPVRDTPVLALECPSPTSGTCGAVLELTATQRDSLLAYPNKNKLTLAVSRAKLGGSR